MRIFTIGYEGATAGEFLAALASAGVERVIDVRALPLSRRPGFSKSPLRAALAEAGLDYVHLKALGTPAAGRAAARAGRYQDVARIYADQLELPEAIAETARMLDLADEKPSALLCYERDPARCHRSLLLAAAAPDADVTHLYALIDGRKMMLDHVGFAVSDLKRSRLFYEAALAPLGLSVLMEVTPDMTESGGTAIGFGKDRHPFFWIGDNERVGEGTHVAFTVENRALVDAFHAAAVAAGGRSRRAGLEATLPPQLLCGLRAGPGRDQRGSGLPRPRIGLPARSPKDSRRPAGPLRRPAAPRCRGSAGRSSPC